MGYLLKQSSAVRPLLFLMIDESDHISGKTGLAPTVTLSKNGGNFAAPAGNVTQVGNGWYQVAGNATDTATLGPLVLHATATGADPCDERFEVVAFDPGDSVRLGMTSLPNAAAGAANGLPALDGSTHLPVYSVSQGVTLAADQPVNVTKWGGTAVASAYVQANAAEVGGQPASATAPVNFDHLAATGSTDAGAFVGAFPAGVFDHLPKSGYSLAGTGGGTGPAAAAATEDIHTTAFKNGTVRLCARVYLDGADIRQADVTAIYYSVYLLDDQEPDARTVVDGHDAVALTASDVIYDTLQSDSEASDYNFKHMPPISALPAFTIAGRNYLVEYTLTPATGQKIMVRFRVNVI